MKPGQSPYRWVVLAASLLTVFAALGVGRFGFTMVLPSMKAGLHLSESGAGSLVTVSLAGYLLMALFCGRIIARFGIRAVVSASLALLAASLLLIGLSGKYGLILACCFVSGIGSGGANIGVMGLPSLWFPRERRGLAGGVIVSGSSFAILAAGVAVPKILASSPGSGFRTALMAYAAAVFAIALLSFLLIRNSPQGGDRATPEKTAAASAFSIYRFGPIWRLALIYVMFGFSYIIYASFFASFLVRETGVTIAQAGRLWSGVGAVSMVSGFLWGAVSDGIGRKYGLAVVFLLQAASYSLFAFARFPAFMYVSAILFALTSWSIPAIMAAAVGDAVPGGQVPAAFGFITFFFGIGQVIAPVAAGRIAEVSGSLSWSFLAAACAAFLGAVGSLFLYAGKKIAGS